MIIKSHYWPNTPHLRELKVYVEGKLELSSFSTLEEINQIINNLIEARQELLMDRMRHKNDNQ